MQASWNQHQRIWLTNVLGARKCHESLICMMIMKQAAITKYGYLSVSTDVGRLQISIKAGNQISVYTHVS